jgi:diguanylate cyclase (GGDEF)-like protein
VSEPQRPDFQSFAHVARLLSSSLDLEVVLRELMHGLERLLSPTHWSLLLYDETAGELVFTLVRGEAQTALANRRLDLSEGVAGWVFSEGRPLLVADVAKDPRFSRRMDQISGFQTRSIIAAPLHLEGRGLGVLELVNATPEREFTATDLEILTSYADFAAIAIQNARTHAEIVRLSQTDTLSGLANAAHFWRCVERAIDAGGTFAIVFFDMDRFKELVDRHGHVRGSAALAEVGRVVGALLEDRELGCRFGGDEFALLLDGADRARADARCQALEEAIVGRTFLDAEGLRLTLGASFGAAIFPDDARSPNDLLHLADERMYAAKRARQRQRLS